MPSEHLDPRIRQHQPAANMVAITTTYFNHKESHTETTNRRRAASCPHTSDDNAAQYVGDSDRLTSHRDNATHQQQQTIIDLLVMHIIITENMQKKLGANYGQYSLAEAHVPKNTDLGQYCHN